MDASIFRLLQRVHRQRSSVETIAASSFSLEHHLINGAIRVRNQPFLPCPPPPNKQDTTNASTTSFLYTTPPYWTGVEWYENYEDYGEHLLNLAWSAAYNPYWLIYSGYKKLTKRTYVDLPVQDNAAHIGIAFNPATIRSMHQLHIHIVRLGNSVAGFAFTRIAIRRIHSRQMHPPVHLPIHLTCLPLIQTRAQFPDQSGKSGKMGYHRRSMVTAHPPTAAYIGACELITVVARVSPCTTGRYSRSPLSSRTGERSTYR